MVQRLNAKGRPVATFPEAEIVGPRAWGEEILLVLSPENYSMKLLKVKAGKKGGLQYHHLKDEASYILSGEMILRFEDMKGELSERVVGPGDWFHFPAGCIHQEEAITDVVRIEVSTPHFNDRVRVESEFGMNIDDDGLPSTTLEDVIIK